MWQYRSRHRQLRQREKVDKETPERVEEDPRKQRIKNQEDLTTNTNRGSGKDAKGSHKGKGKDRTYTNGREPTTRMVHVPSIGQWGIDVKYIVRKFFPEMNNEYRKNQPNDQYCEQRGRAKSAIGKRSMVIGISTNRLHAREEIQTKSPHVCRESKMGDD